MTFNRDYLPAIGLGITQIMGYGVLYYAYAILLPKMAEPIGLSLSGIFGVLSLALFLGGFMSPVAGILTDSLGGRYVMTGGAVIAGLATMTLSLVDGGWACSSASLSSKPPQCSCYTRWPLLLWRALNLALARSVRSQS